MPFSTSTTYYHKRQLVIHHCENIFCPPKHDSTENGTLATKPFYKFCKWDVNPSIRPLKETDNTELIRTSDVSVNNGTYSDVSLSWDTLNGSWNQLHCLTFMEETLINGADSDVSLNGTDSDVSLGGTDSDVSL